MTITARVLGPVSIDGPDTSSDASPSLSPKLQLVLGLLAARRGSVVSVDRLCEALWGDEQPAAAAATLQSHISRLRRALLPSGHIVALDRGYWLELPDGHLDVDLFTQLTDQATAAAPTDPRTATQLYNSALALWRGPAFGDLADVDGIRPESVRLDELYLSVVESYIDCRLAAGGDTGLIGDLEGRIIAHPLRERFVRQLMLALFRADRQADSLRRASEFRRLLRDEMGLEPSPALIDLEARILADDSGLLLDGGEPPPARSWRRVADGPTRLVGRDAEVDQIAAAVHSMSLVTLLGPGGVGKTRLARRVAATANNFENGVAFIELAAVSDPGSLTDVIATALDIQPRQHLSIEDTLLATLSDNHQLIVFDNCEHQLDSPVPLVDRLLTRCPHVHVLVTTREPLGLPVEVVVTVAPLNVGSADNVDLTTLATTPAVELLLDRVGAAVPGFTMTPANASVLGEICRRLDGLPLALELVAAQFRSLAPETILQRLMLPAGALAASMRSANPRHRTLRDTIAWSYEHLTHSEQAAYARMSVFAGTFALPAVESVCGEPHGTGDIVQVLTSLVDKSMVQMVDSQDGRYQLLETLREFGREKLAEQGLLDEVAQRHLTWFVEFAELCSIGMTGPDEPIFSQRIEHDFDNFRMALGTAVRTDDADASLRITAALREFAFRRIRYELTSWAASATAVPLARHHPRFPTVLAIVGYGHFVRGNLIESIEVSQQAIASGRALNVDTNGLAERTLLNAHFYLGNAEAALRWGDEMLLSGRNGSPARLAHALYMRSVAETSVGRTVQGAIMAGEASATARACGSPTARAQAAYALGLALEGSDPGESLRLLRESAQLAGLAGNRWIEAFADTEVWWLEARSGDVRTALAGSGVVIETWNRGGDWANLRLSLRRVFGLLAQIGDHRAAAVLHGALDASGATSALPFEPNAAHDDTAAVAELRAELGDPEFEASAANGVALTEVELVNFVLASITAHSAA